MIAVENFDARADKEIERLGAEDARKDALIEYVAMMADVELPEEEEAEYGVQ